MRPRLRPFPPDEDFNWTIVAFAVVAVIVLAFGVWR